MLDRSRFRKLKTRRRKGYTVTYWQDRMTGQLVAFTHSFSTAIYS